jgi:DUF2934 family protein
MAEEPGRVPEIEDVPASAYEMERRLLAAKNVYAENEDQKRDSRHSYSSYTLGHHADEHGKIVLTAEERYHLIAKEAYFRAKQRGFQGPSFVQEWVEAESEIDRLVKGDAQEPAAPHPDRTLHGHE